MIAPTRRSLLGAGLKAGGLVLAGLAVPAIARAARGSVAEITMRSDADGAHVWFDPIGLLVEPGQTVRWTNAANVHTATAYHPANANHALRIPEGAAPWDSGYLVNPGDTFAVTLTVEGVYDYYCAPHEPAGMVGRIIVGRPAGPATLPLDVYRARYADKGWESPPPAALNALPEIAAIMRDRIVRLSA